MIAGVAGEAGISARRPRLPLKLDGRYSIYEPGGGKALPARGISAADFIVRWDERTRSALVTQLGTIPMRLQRIDLSSGRRAAVLTVEPPSREGLIGYSSMRVADDARSYTCTIDQLRSTLFLVESGRARGPAGTRR